MTGGVKTMPQSKNNWILLINFMNSLWFKSNTTDNMLGLVLKRYKQGKDVVYQGLS